MALDTLLLIAAFLCFAFAAVGVAPKYIQLTPLGLALCVLAVLIEYPVTL